MTRVEAMVMLLRVMGCEADALAGNLKNPFEDTPKWADAYLGYAYGHKLTYGISDTVRHRQCRRGGVFDADAPRARLFGCE